MTRATLYLLAAGAVWFAEGYIFGTVFRFSRGQTALLGGVYLALWVTACILLLRLARRPAQEREALPVWRYLSLAPMLVATLGSFASLPILVAIAALGKLT
jgi:hypothetical protein